MRKHSAAMALGAAVLAIGGLAAPVAQAAPSGATAWQYINTYPSKFSCVDAGQLISREQKVGYKCEAVNQNSEYRLYIGS